MSFFPPVRDSKARPKPRDYRVPLSCRHGFCPEESDYNSICLAVAVWLMIHPRSPKLEWSEDQSLDQFIAATFAVGMDDEPELKDWSKDLNAYTFDHIGRFEIFWTRNLPDHLLLEEENDKKGVLHLYHHASTLQVLWDEPLQECVLNSSSLPK
jgi:hypothetical protein